MKRLTALVTLMLLMMALCALGGGAEAVAPEALHTYGGADSEECTGALALTDGFLIYGNARSDDGDLAGESIAAENRAAWAVCTGLDGEIRWTLLIDEPGASFRAATALADGTFLMALSSHVDGVGAYRNYHIGADGTILSEKDIASETISQQGGQESLMQIVDEPSGYRFIVTDVHGDEILQMTLTMGEEGYLMGGAMKQITDGYLLTSSDQAEPDSPEWTPSLTKFDEEGRPMWSTSIPIKGQTNVTSLIENEDGSFTVVGRGTFSPDLDSYDYDYVTFAAKVDANGTLLWHHTYEIGDKLQLERVTAVPGGYIAVADTAIHDDENAQIYLVCLDEEGEVQDTWPVAIDGKWHTIYPNEIAYADGAVYIAGSITPPLASNDYDMDFALLRAAIEH